MDKTGDSQEEAMTDAGSTTAANTANFTMREKIVIAIDQWMDVWMDVWMWCE